jgi:type II secretory pathway pseudopilin PulG
MKIRRWLKRSPRGIGLLELMLSLAVIAILLVMATRFFGVTHRAQELNHAAKDVAFVMAGVHNWQAGKGNFSGISLQELAAQGLLPDDITNDGFLPAWGGCESAKVTIQSGGLHAAHVEIAMRDISLGICQGLQSRFSSADQRNSMIKFSQCVTDHAHCRSRFTLQVR